MIFIVNIVKGSKDMRFSPKRDIFGENYCQE